MEDLVNTSQQQESKVKQTELFAKMLESEAARYRSQRNVVIAILIVLGVAIFAFFVAIQYRLKDQKKQEQASGMKVTSMDDI